jgi:hypothetical protein
MKRLRLVSFLGLIFSLLAHLISWTTPNMLHFVMMGIPLHFVAMLIVFHLYKQRVLPLQKNADLQWFHNASSGIHALIFLAVLSLLFHTIMVALQLSVVVMFLIRAVSGIWLYIYAIGYAYASWVGRNQFRYNLNSHQETHCKRFRQKGDIAKLEQHISPPQTLRRRL